MRSNLPKVLHPLAGQPMLSHVLATAKKLNPKNTVIVVGHGGDSVRSHFSDNQITWVTQEPQLGTGHALMQVLPHMSSDGVVLVLYADVPLVPVATLQKLVAASAGKNLALLVQVLENPQGYGRILRNSDGLIHAIREHKDASEEERLVTEVNTGIMAIPAMHANAWIQALDNNNAQKEYYLTDVVAKAVEDSVPVMAVFTDHEWEALGVNSKEQLAELERQHQKNQAQALLEQGITLMDPARFDLRGTLECGRDVVIDVGCIFDGQVKLGDGVKVGAYSILKNCEVGAHTVIHPFCHLEGGKLGSENIIGPYARIRPGTTTDHGVHLGNFVEVKNSQVGEGSKANHLSYVGDSTVGRNVNVGAGTITCNYDGVNKHRTIIEDDVFIGSDTQLVAPVTVAAGSTIGAGSTIVSNTPAHQLTVSRSKQISIPRWTRPQKNK